MTADDLPRDVFRQVLALLVDSYRPPSRTSAFGEDEDEDEEQISYALKRWKRPAWISAGRDLAACACVCRSWRDALGGSSGHGHDASAWGRACELQSLFGLERDSTRRAKLNKLAKKRSLSNERDWRKEFERRVLWHKRVRSIIESEIMWPNEKAAALKALEGDLSQSQLVALWHHSSLVSRAPRKFLEKRGAGVPVGTIFWSHFALWTLRSAEGAENMAAACATTAANDSPAEGPGTPSDALWHRLCGRREEVRIETGAMAIACLFNIHLDQSVIPSLLDQLAAELRRRLEILSSVIKAARGPQAEALTERQQILCLSSLIFNPSNQAHSGADALAAHWPEAEIGLGRALDHEDLEALVSQWPGLGLEGNRSDYYNPENSRLDCVLGVETRAHQVGGRESPLSSILRSERKPCGNPLTLSIIYAAVGRRAGLPVRMINAPGHFLVGLGRDCFVDVFLGGRLRTREEVFSLVSQIVGAPDGAEMDDMLAQASAHPSEVNLRICNNLIHTFAQERDYPKLLSATRMALAIKPNNKALLMKAAKVEAVLDNYGELGTKQRGLSRKKKRALRMKSTGTNFSRPRRPDEAIEHMDRLQSVAGAEELYCKRIVDHFKVAKMLHLKAHTAKKVRTEDILFRVGQIIRHRRYCYRGVIFGWESKCEAGEEWIQQMRVDALPDGRNQPFYKVLVDCRGDRGGFHSTTYVAQENIQVETLKPGVDTDCHQINHPETGKYFDVYRVTGSGPHHQHYKANEVVASQYPEDYAIDEDAE